MTEGDARGRPRQQVFTLLVEIGRKAGDGLPEAATGAALVVYASGIDEDEAVRETVAVLKQADTAPLDVTGYGTAEERAAGAGEDGGRVGDSGLSSRSNRRYVDEPCGPPSAAPKAR